MESQGRATPTTKHMQIYLIHSYVCCKLLVEYKINETDTSSLYLIKFLKRKLKKKNLIVKKYLLLNRKKKFLTFKNVRRLLILD